MKILILAFLLLAFNGLVWAAADIETNKNNKATEKRSEDLTQRVVISNDKKSEEYAIIAPNGAPILASSVPGIPGGAPPLIPAIGAPVVPLPPLARPTIVAPHRSNKKRKILRALLRERPGLLRRLLRRKLQQKIVPVEIPGSGLVKIRSGVPSKALPDLSNPSEESYVAVSGRPGQRTVHVVNGRGGDFAGTVLAGPGDSGHSPNANTGYGDYDYVFDLDNDGDADFYDGPLGARPAVPGFEPLGEPRPGLITKGRDKIGFSPLPRCTYLNTDLYGDDVGDGKGISTGSATGCKEQCAAQDSCQFWTFREGWARDCYLKRGRRGDPTYTNAVPKVGYVSGTKGDICSCLANSANSDEEVCPISYSRPVYPWKPRKNKNTGRGRGRGGSNRCTDTSGAIIPCADDSSCFDSNGIRIPGCQGGRGRGGNDDGNDGGVYRYDYDDLDIRPTSSSTTPGGIGRNRCVDANGVVIPCDSEAIDDGLATTRPIGGRRQRPNRLSNNEAEETAVEEKKEVPGEDL